jgi:Peptidase family M23/Calx-beta domain/Fibronectin type III domain/Carbohydrate binding domain
MESINTQYTKHRRQKNRGARSGRRWLAQLLTAAVLGAMLSLTPAFGGLASAVGGDVFAAGTQYCADSYSGHPSPLGNSGNYVVDINFPGDSGSPVYAPANGSVSIYSNDAGNGTGYGNSVTWTSANGSEKLFLAHLASFGATGGVTGGQQIGTIGSTGNSTGPHLHIARSVNGSLAPMVLSGNTITPAFPPDSSYGVWPCNGATYTSSGPIGTGNACDNTELLGNRGFETGTNLSPWRRINLAATTNWAVYSNSSASHGGSNFLESNTSQPNGSIGQDIAISVEAGKYYRFRIWARSSTPTTARISLWALGGSSENAGTTVALTPTWVPVDVVLRPTANHSSLRAEMYMQTTGVNFRWDDASVSCSSTPPSIYDKNPFGSYDLASSPAAGQARVRGWGLDSSAWASPVRIHAYVGGAAGAPGVEGFDLGLASSTRNDVAAAYPWAGAQHGYDFTFATAKRGSQQVCVYLIDIGEGSNTSIGCKTVTISGAVPGTPGAIGAEVGTTGVDVAWTAATANGFAIDDYEVEWEEQGGANTGTQSAGTALTANVAVPNPGMPYRFRVRAHNSDGWGAPSTWTGYVVVEPGPSIRPYGVVVNPEGDSGLTSADVVVFLESPSAVPVSIDWTIGDVPSNPRVAHPGSDIVAASGTVTFAPGETQQTFPIEVIGDTADEPALLYGEWGIATFSNPVNGVLDTTTFFGLALIIIIDDDPTPVVTIGDASVSEGNTGTTTLSMPLTLTNPSGAAVTVDWSTTDDTATSPSDFVAGSGTATFPIGSTTTTIDVTVNGDFDPEPDEDLTVTITNAVNATLGAATVATGTILDDADTGVTVPDAPATATAASGSNGAVPISWTPPANTGGAPIINYEIQRGTSGTIVSDTASPYTWGGLANGTSYTFRVRACNVAGCGAWRTTNAATPYTTPSTIGKPAVTSLNNAIRVNWNAPNNGGSAITKYEVQYGSTVVNNGTSRTRTVGFGQSGATRTFRVRACNAKGCGGWSSYSNAIRPKVIAVSKGSSAPFGFWYNTTVYGPPNWTITLLCNDGVDLAFYSQTITTNSSGAYTDTTLCYSGDLNPHWVNSGSLRSNNVNF